MDNSRLTPYDGELQMMVRSLTGKPCEIHLGGEDEFFIVVDYSGHPDSDYISALMDAVAGRVGKRLVKIEDEPDAKRFVARIKYSEDEYPCLMRLDPEQEQGPHPENGDVYFMPVPIAENNGNDECIALQVTRANIERLLAFVGNGEMEIEKRPGGKATFHFKNAGNSVYAHAPEFSYIIYNGNDHFSIMEQTLFEANFKKK